MPWPPSLAFTQIPFGRQRKSFLKSVQARSATTSPTTIWHSQILRHTGFLLLDISLPSICSTLGVSIRSTPIASARLWPAPSGDIGVANPCAYNKPRGQFSRRKSWLRSPLQLLDQRLEPHRAQISRGSSGAQGRGWLNTDEDFPIGIAVRTSCAAVARARPALS